MASPEALALLEAAQKNDYDLVEKLLSQNIPVDVKDKLGRTPLQLAASNRKGLKIVNLLISKGANVNNQDVANFFPLYYPACSGHIAIVDALLNAGANPHLEPKNGDKILYRAALRGHTEIVIRLIKAGADVNQRDDNDTPLHGAAQRGHSETVRALLENGAEIDAIGKHGTTSLHESVMHMLPHVTLELLDAGANANTTREYKKTPLHDAHAQEDIAHLLVLYGADIAAQDSNGYTPVQCASPDTRKAIEKAMNERNKLRALGQCVLDFNTAIKKGFKPKNDDARIGDLPKEIQDKIVDFVAGHHITGARIEGFSRYAGTWSPSLLHNSIRSETAGSQSKKEEPNRSPSPTNG